MMNAVFAGRGDGRRRFNPRRLVWMAPLAVAVAVGLFFGLGKLVVWLWRATLVDLFAIKPISFWQAWGLILLSQILFKANMQPTTRTGRWRRRDPVCGGSPEVEPEPPLHRQEG
jgi:hypothetical protein